jgi:hypothetical protein
MKEDRQDRRTDDLLLLSFHNSTKHLSLFFPLSPLSPSKTDGIDGTEGKKNQGRTQAHLRPSRHHIIVLRVE